MLVNFFQYLRIFARLYNTHETLIKVGGCAPGMKLGTFTKEGIVVEGISLPKLLIEEFNKRLLLIYTGKTRLAKNLLQVCDGNMF